tara:strand:- start:842 stop:1945 length:1104 start_codon:yes stop_codon:yes gene_type:complete
LEKVVIIANTKWFVLNFKEWLLRELIKKYEVEIFFINNGPPSHNEYLLKNNNLKFIKLNSNSFLKYFFKFKKPKYLFSFTIHGICLSPILFPNISQKIATIEGFGRLFSSSSNLDFTNKIVLFVYKNIFKFYYDKVFVLNFSDIKFLLDKKIVSFKKLKYLPGTGININFFSRKPKPFKLLKPKITKINVGMISRNIPEKGINTFIASKFALIRQFNDLDIKVNYIIFMPKKDIFKLSKELIQELEKYNIKLSQYNKNPLDTYSQIDILVQPSIYFEGLSRVILEAGCLQIPIIACKNRGIVDILPNKKYGYILDKDSFPIEICQNIQKIIQNPDIANNKAEKLRDHIIKNFNEKIISTLFFKEIDL